MIINSRFLTADIRMYREEAGLRFEMSVGYRGEFSRPQILILSIDRGEHLERGLFREVLSQMDRAPEIRRFINQLSDDLNHEDLIRRHQHVITASEPNFFANQLRDLY